MSRLLSLDAAKGLGIVLVVFGHAVARNVADPLSTSYWLAIHFFHMALFIFISGWVAYGKVNNEWLSRRFLQLMIPYCAWHVLLYYWTAFSFSGLEGNYPTSGGLLGSFIASTGGCTGLWFLDILFALCCLLYLSNGRPILLLLFAVAFYLITEVPALHVLNPIAGRIAWFVPFFALGYLTSKYRHHLAKLRLAKYACIVAFPLAFYFGSSLHTWVDYSQIVQEGPVIVCYKFLMSLLGIGMVFAIVELPLRVNLSKRFVCYLGTVTIGIYAGHGLWLKLGVGDDIMRAATATLVSLMLSLALIRVFRKFTLTDYLFLGGAQKLVAARKLRVLPKTVVPR